MGVTSIINAIDIILEKIYKSVEQEVFKTIDELLVINEKILLEEPLQTLFVKFDEKSLVVLSSSFVIFFLIYYLITRLLAMYSGTDSEDIFKCIFRIIVCAICSMSSLYICEQILSINGMLTEVIKSVGYDLTKSKVCFESLKEVLVNVDKYMSSDTLSIDGVIKGVISFGASTILISFAIRKVTVIFLLFISPIAIMFASSEATYGIFKSWIKMFLINILLQNIVCVILMIPLALKQTNGEMYKIIIVGSIYLLYKINNFTKDFLGTISEKTTRSR